MPNKVLSVCSFLLVVMVFSGCLNRQFVKGYSELLEVRDSLLNDSSIISGFIYQYYEDTSFKQALEGAEIQIEGISLIAESGESGVYSLKVAPGNYNIFCKRKNERWPQLYERIDGLEIERNKVVRLDFYLGYTIE